MDAFARCSGTRQIGTPASAHASTVAMTSSEEGSPRHSSKLGSHTCFLDPSLVPITVLRGQPRTLTS